MTLKQIRVSGIRLGVALWGVLFAWQAINLLQADMLRQEIASLMQGIQRHQIVDHSQLREKANQVTGSGYSRYLLEFRADANTLLRYLSDAEIVAEGAAEHSAERFNLEQTLSDYRQALAMRPLDSNLWARYAQFLDSSTPHASRNEFLQALEKVMVLGPNDYRNIRISALLGIRNWPHLTCSLRLRLVSMLKQAENIDDQILARWNTDLRQTLLVKYLHDLYQHYQFNLSWADISSRNCRVAE